MSNKQSVALTVYEKFINGDSINDAELTEAASFFEKLEKDLRMVGPIFKLAASEAGRVYQLLYAAQQARARRAHEVVGLDHAPGDPR